ncbi:hypothetical protein [Sphingomonas sp. ID0503]|uniref:hypothetical protein n=1 Tax=Sphingomonas sp. ID0503 TaxID=3399691 RepID=UPI003AFA39E3
MNAMERGLADVPHVDKAPWVLAFGNEADGWDIEGDEDDDGEATGLPGERLVSDALGSFAGCWGDYHRASAAKIFNLPVDLIAALDPQRFEADAEDVALDDLGTLIQVIGGCRTQFGSCSVADMARFTNQHPTRIIQAMGNHPWMFLSGDRDNFAKLFIEHEGE